MKRAVVVGGGITGLVAAYRLKTQAAKTSLPLDITVLEASPRLGGVLHSTRRDQFLLEGGPDCFLSNKPRGMELCEELDLANELISTRTEFRRSFIVRRGKLCPVPEGFYLLAPSQLRPFLSTELLSWRGKWRALLEPLLPSRSPDDESLASFVRRRMGQEVLDWLAQPLLAGIYAADPEKLSLQATFPLFIELEKKYGSVLLGLTKQKDETLLASGARYSLFMTFKNGMESLIHRLVERLDGVSLQTGTPAKHLRKSDAGWEIQLRDGKVLQANTVCLALPSHQSANLLELQNKALAEELRAIPYASSITLNLAFDAGSLQHPLDGAGFVTPAAERDVPIACTFVHQKFSGRAPAGSALLRAFVGGDAARTLMERDEKDVAAFVLEELSPLLGITRKPRWTAMERWPQTMPQYTLGHLQRILKIEETALGLPGLALAGNWQYGVGIPDCIRSAERAADALLAYSSSHFV